MMIHSISKLYFSPGDLSKNVGWGDAAEYPPESRRRELPTPHIVLLPGFCLEHALPFMSSTTRDYCPNFKPFLK